MMPIALCYLAVLDEVRAVSRGLGAVFMLILGGVSP